MQKAESLSFPMADMTCSPNVMVFNGPLYGKMQTLFQY